MDTAATITLNKIRAACKAGGISPSNTELVRKLKAWRYKRTQREIDAIITELAAAGKIEVHAREYGGRRWFRIPGTNLATVQREVFQRPERPVPPPPKPANAYDANLKLGSPIRIVGRPDSQRPMPRVVTPHVPTHSECGCSAAECVA